MKIKFILPALQEAKSPFWRPIKYSLFPPLGLATLASCCLESDEISLADEHVESISLEDEPDLVCIQTYITNAWRAYEIADAYRKRGIYVVLGGLHATTLPLEALEHADTVLLGLGEHAFARFLQDLRARQSRRIYEAGPVSLDLAPLPRRDLFKREKYLVPNSMVISRGCPNRCSFCYVSSFYPQGQSFLSYQLDHILREIDSMPGKHLYFLDDNLFGNPALCRELFREMRGMGRLFQGAVTISSVLDGDLVELAREAGFRSAFIGFESVSANNLLQANKQTNLNRSYKDAIQRLDRLGIMINGSFIFGFDEDDLSVFRDLPQWAIEQGITTATYHILTPYPGTRLFADMTEQGRIVSRNWQEYDTRHLVFQHPRLTRIQMEEGYRQAYQTFYQWRNIRAASGQHEALRMRLKHLAYAGCWKKFEPVWNFLIKTELLGQARKALEFTLK